MTNTISEKIEILKSARLDLRQSILDWEIDNYSKLVYLSRYCSQGCVHIQDVLKLFFKEQFNCSYVHFVNPGDLKGISDESTVRLEDFLNFINCELQDNSELIIGKSESLWLILTNNNLEGFTKFLLDFLQLNDTYEITF